MEVNTKLCAAEVVIRIPRATPLNTRQVECKLERRSTPPGRTWFDGNTPHRTP